MKRATLLKAILLLIVTAGSATAQDRNPFAGKTLRFNEAGTVPNKKMLDTRYDALFAFFDESGQANI